MELTSEPHILVEHVTDINLTSVGSSRSFTLHTDKGDSWREEPDRIIVEIRSLPIPETGTFYKDLLASVEIRTRLVKTPVKDAPKAGA